jgi:hypothetical protein
MSTTTLPEWFDDELEAFAEDSTSYHSNAILLEVASEMRQAKISDVQRARYKGAVLRFIPNRLPYVRERLQDAFFSFLALAELVEDSFEVRTALHDLLRHRSQLDELTINIATALLSTEKIPAAQVREEVFASAREEFSRRPRWGLVSILAKVVGRLPNDGYPLAKFVEDIGRLNGPGFSRAVTLRDPLWRSLSPPVDSIYLLNEVGRRAPSTNRNYPRNSLTTLDQRMTRRAGGVNANVILADS